MAAIIETSLAAVVIACAIYLGVRQEAGKRQWVSRMATIFCLTYSFVAAVAGGGLCKIGWEDGGLRCGLPIYPVGMVVGPGDRACI